MNKQFDLREYVNTVVELERDNRTLANSIGQLKQRRSHLGEKRSIPNPPCKEVIEKPAGDDEIPFGVVLIVLGFLAVIFFKWFLWGLLSWVGIVLLIAGILVGGLLIEIGISNDKEADERYQKEVNRAERNYKINTYNYQSYIATCKRDIANEKAMIPTVESDIRALIKQYNDTSNLLKQYYDLNVIHPSYRNLSAMAMFSQYLNTGRCTVLEGHEGCYNLYEAEKRQNMIITQLDRVLSKLDSIQENQYELFHALQISNNNIAQLTQYSRNVANHAQAMQQHLAAVECQTEQANRIQQATQDYMITRDLWNSI